MAVGNEEIRDFLSRVADALDREAWDEFLSMCAPGFEYRVTAHSYELDEDMIWLIHDLDGLRHLFDVLPEQLGRRGTRMLRHVSFAGIEPGEAEGQFVATSKVLAVLTSPEGVSELFAAGRYVDVVDAAGAAPRLLRRETRLERLAGLRTRELGIGSHVPI